MATAAIIHSLDELRTYKETITSNLNKGIKQLQELLANGNPLHIFQMFKFEKFVAEPLSGKQENLIEVINQSMTYIVSLMAVEYLLKTFPDKAFIINWGNASGYDIISEDGCVICECFAATSYRSNGKLSSDLKRLNKASADYRYEFFYDKEYTESQNKYYNSKYPNIQIIKFDKVDM
jgi:hypothetical protein